MNTLDLRLHGVYFDLIKAGKKKKEYRKLDDCYIGRLIGGVDMKSLSKEEQEEVIENLKDPSKRDEYMKKKGMFYRVGNNPNAYANVRFRRGATPVFLTAEIKDMEINAGQFVITLGKILSEK